MTRIVRGCHGPVREVLERTPVFDDGPTPFLQGRHARWQHHPWNCLPRAVIFVLADAMGLGNIRFVLFIVTFIGLALKLALVVLTLLLASAFPRASGAALVCPSCPREHDHDQSYWQLGAGRTKKSPTNVTPQMAA